MSAPILRLIGFPGTGSAIGEAFLSLGKISYESENIDYDREGAEKERLLAVNPLGELPTLILPDGEVLTETLAIATFVQTSRPEVALIPSSGGTRFWRWVMFINTAIYPTFTYGDEPRQWVQSEDGARELRASTDEWRKELWRQVEAAVEGPFFMGEHLCAIDVYLAVMIHWRPRSDWFRQACPKIFAIACAVARHPQLVPIWKRHFREIELEGS